MRRVTRDPAPPHGLRNYLESSVVMRMFKYHDRSAFWEFVYSEGVPHTRFTSRKIMFEETALNEWLDRRSSG